MLSESLNENKKQLFNEYTNKIEKLIMYGNNYIYIYTFSTYIAFNFCLFILYKINRFDLELE
jgi:hypothetical protein